MDFHYVFQFSLLSQIILHSVFQFKMLNSFGLEKRNVFHIIIVDNFFDKTNVTTYAGGENNETKV